MGGCDGPGMHTLEQLLEFERRDSIPDIERAFACAEVDELDDLSSDCPDYILEYAMRLPEYQICRAELALIAIRFLNQFIDEDFGFTDEKARERDAKAFMGKIMRKLTREADESGAIPGHPVRTNLVWCFGDLLGMYVMTYLEKTRH